MPPEHGADPYARPVYARLRRAVPLVRRPPPLDDAGTTALAFVVSGAGMTLVQQQFFPTASRLELIVDLRLREGALFTAHRRARSSAWKKFFFRSRTRRLPTSPPTPAPVRHAFSCRSLADLPNPGLAQIIVNTRSIADPRGGARPGCWNSLPRTSPQFPDLRGRVTRFEFGPPVGFPVQFRVIGPDTGKGTRDRRAGA